MASLSVEETEKKLDEVSSSFCAAKWSQVLFNLQVGERHNCCLGAVQKINTDLIQKDSKHLFNDDVLKAEREQMLRGEKIKGCNVCWSAESKGFHSDRHFKSSAEWSQKFLNKENLSLENVTPTYVEVSFGNKCQMSCTYCSPNNSSSLARESKNFGSYRLSQDHNWLDKNLEHMFLDESENHIYAKTFWEWFLKNNQSFQVMRFTGGEPLISKWMDKFLDWLKDNSMEHADLAFNSNLGVPVELMEKFIKKLKLIPRNHYKNLQFFTSLDGWGSGAELARYGIKLSVFERNLNLLFDNFPSSLFRITATLNVFAFPDMKKLLEKVYELKQRSQYQDQVAIVSYPIFYPSFLSLGWTKEIYSKYYNECMEYIEEHLVGKKSEFGFHEFEKEYFQKAVTFKENESKESRYVDIFLYLSQFKLRKGLKNLDCPEDVKKMIDEGYSILLNGNLSDYNIGIWARSEPWIEDKFRKIEIRRYIINEIKKGQYNAWDIIGVQLDYIGHVLSDEWITFWMREEKLRLAGFELLSKFCFVDFNKYETQMREELIKSLSSVDEYLVNQLSKYVKLHKLNWSKDDLESIKKIKSLNPSGATMNLINAIESAQ